MQGLSLTSCIPVENIHLYQLLPTMDFYFYRIPTLFSCWDLGIHTYCVINWQGSMALHICLGVPIFITWI